MDVWSAYSPHLDRSILVHAGTESDGSAIYVGRAHHSGDLIPGKLLTGVGFHHRCHVSYNGEEFSKDSSEVLINNGYTWMHSSSGHVPQGAVVGGYTSSGETLYVGRASHCGILTPGKVHPSHRCLYLPFGWKEHSYPNYEVLVRQHGHCPPPQHPIHPCPPPVHPPSCPCPPNVQPPVRPCHPILIVPRPPILCPPRGGGHHHHGRGGSHHRHGSPHRHRRC